MTDPTKLRDRLHALRTPPRLVPPPDLADDVLAAVRRRSQAGRIGAVAAAMVAVGLATLYIVQPDAPGGAPIEVAGSGGSAVMTTIPATTTAPATTGKLVPGPAPSLGMFPFTPGQAHAYRLGRLGVGAILTPSWNNRTPSGPQVYVGPDPAHALRGKGTVTGTTATTVRGKSATVTRMTDLVEVIWQEQPGVWVVVASPSLPEADVVRYAQELRPQPQPIPMPLDFAWLPTGMTIASTADGAVDEAVLFATEKGFDGDTIVVNRMDDEIGKAGDAIPVGNRTGRISRHDGGTTLRVPLPGQGNLSIAVRDTLGFTQQDLVRFALGITNP
ncbi:MAG: hypothetical protein ABW224_06315 [Kibdelosporangium sp.]